MSLTDSSTNAPDLIKKVSLLTFRVHEDLVGLRHWILSDGLHRVLRQVDLHPNQ